MSIRKALLVGINAYPGTPLRGCINDVMQMKAVLQRYYDFSDDNIRLLLDCDATTAGIKAGLAWLAQEDADANAVRLFHYSGHGAHVADKNGDEPDGRDECLVPYDYQSTGMLTDDALKQLYDRFPRTGNLTLIMDSCHSGSVNRVAEADITYRFLPVSLAEQIQIDTAAEAFAQQEEAFVVEKLLRLRDQPQSEEEIRRKVRSLMTLFEKKRFGDIRVREANLLLAGCRADQQAADAPIAGAYHGAFTYYLVQAITQANGQLTYRQLIQQTMQQLASGGFVQVPQLEYRKGYDERLLFSPFA